MCGLFGLVRNSFVDDGGISSSALQHLGMCSDSRGGDGSGILGVKKGTQFETNNLNPYSYYSKNSTTTIIKNNDLYQNLCDNMILWNLVATSGIVLGHTRKATVGKTGEANNLSPMIAGSIAGTHNGTVDVESIILNDIYDYRGGTDSERIFFSLSDAENVLDRFERLSVMVGSLATVWLDEREPQKLFLSKMCSSPLSYAYDQYDNFYWATLSPWFTEVENMMDGQINFKRVTKMETGTSLIVDYSNGNPEISFTNYENFYDNQPFLIASGETA